MKWNDQNSFLTPIPRAYPKFCLLGGVARITVLLLYGDAKSRQLSWLAPFVTYHLVPERKNHLDVAGIESGSSAWEEAVLSITPCLSGNDQNSYQSIENDQL